MLLIRGGERPRAERLLADAVEAEEDGKKETFTDLHAHPAISRWITPTLLPPLLQFKWQQDVTKRQ